MATTTVRVGDVGAALEVTVKRSGAVVNIITAGTKQILVINPDGVLAATLTGGFLTDGSDGVLTATSTSACFDRAGRWVLVPYIASMGGWTGHGTPVPVLAIAVGLS